MSARINPGDMIVAVDDNTVTKWHPPYALTETFAASIFSNRSMAALNAYIDGFSAEFRAAVERVERWRPACDE